MADLAHILGLLGMTIATPDLLRRSIAKHEGCRLSPYLDTAGKLTIGYGHNLTDDGISPDIAAKLLTEDIQTAINQTQRLLPWVETLDDPRKRAFVEIVFNLGDRILGFHIALQTAQRGDWEGCVAGFRDSRWHTQVGHRALDLENMLLTGHDPN